MLKSKKAHSSKFLQNQFEKCESSKQNFVKTSFNYYKHGGPSRSYKGKHVKSIWVPKGLINSPSNDILEWIPKGTSILETNINGPKRIWVPKTKF